MGSIPAPGRLYQIGSISQTVISYNRAVTPTRYRIRTAQTLIEQARGRTKQSAQLLLQTANRILTFQLHSPGLVLEAWTLYEVMVTPRRCAFRDGGRPDPTT